MATKKKLLQAAAGTAAASGGAGALNVEDVFSTYLYEGNGSAQVIENGINLGQSYGSGSISVPRGEDNNVTTSTNSDFAYGTGDFTWEAWIMPQVDDGTLNNSNRYIFDHGSGNLGGMSYYNGVLRYYNSTTNAQDSTQALTNYTWAHIAACRSSGTTKVFYNGTQILSFSDSYNFTATSFVIGDYGGSGGTYSFGGLYSDVRVSNTARYTSNFTPPTSSFSSDSNTVLLAGQGSTIVDNSSNALTLTANGDAVGKSFGYYDAADAGEGGLVWAKQRTGSSSQHALFDTENGTLKALASSSTAALATEASVTSFNANGFSLGNFNNTSGQDYVSWTFRKAPKFFDVVTYTGTGSAQNISHDLGTTVGTLIVKRTDSADRWRVYHRGVDATSPQNYFMNLNETAAAAAASTVWNNTAPTNTTFTVGTSPSVNASGGTYVAYLFAHNDGDGDFGPDSDADIIKCGSFTTDGSGIATVNLGFEPQWILIKRTNSTGSWHMVDAMRGMPNGANDAWLMANNTNAESTAYTIATPTATGFVTDSTNIIDPSSDFLYIAIRRGPMAVPTDATEVFAIDELSSAAYYSGFTVDMAIERDTGFHPTRNSARLIGEQYLDMNTAATASGATNYAWDNSTGWFDYQAAANRFSWMWARAPQFMDCVSYTGTGSLRTVNHNLGVVPEMMIFKNLDTSGTNWDTYHKDLGASGFVSVNLNNAYTANTNRFNGTTPTDTQFTVNTAARVNESGSKLIAYLFATLDGISKVGSYTGNGTSQNIDCGFSNGARFVVIKRTDAVGDWNFYDTERGIVSGNDSRLVLNEQDGADASSDRIDPYSSGFTVNYIATGTSDSNISGATYIFYAIA